MALTVFRRISARLPEFSSRFQSTARFVCSRTPGFPHGENNEESTRLDIVDESTIASKNHISKLLSFVGDTRSRLDGCVVETVDDDAWQVSSSLAQAWRAIQAETGTNSYAGAQDRVIFDDQVDPDLDEIDNLRIYGNLFYKIDRGSKEFEEHNYDFHRKKPLKPRKEENREEVKRKEPEKSKEGRGEYNKKDNPRHKSVSKIKSLSVEMDNNPCVVFKKKERTPTFNQLTAPYHYPFCLDIYVSKASIRACVVHRVTSKVVAVAHSISKDIKYDLGSTRNAAACAAVGRILAQRALADDIHDVIYTPRKGEKLEGKLQIVLQAIVDGGIEVRVKLKQRKLKKTNHLAIA